MKIHGDDAKALLARSGVAKPVDPGRDVPRTLHVHVGIDRHGERVAVTTSGGSDGATQPSVRAALEALARAFVAHDALAADVDLGLGDDGEVVLLAASLDIDPNALFRHPDLVALHDTREDDPAEAEAARFDLAYIALDGDIGCLVNGAGLAMATMDLVHLDGGTPANFLDVGGDATTEQVAEAFKLMMRKPGLKAVLVNIFGGIMRCDVIANGLVEAVRQVDLTVPLVVRLTGTNEDLGKKILRKSGLPIVAAHDMADAAAKAVRAARGQ